MTNKIELTLKSQASPLNNIICYEPIDEIILDKLINSSIVLEKIKNNCEQNIYINEREKLIAYKDLIRDGKAKIEYKMSKNMTFGRVHPKNGLGLFNMKRIIRNTLAKNNFHDIDIQNAHPTILYQICKQNNINCQNLEKYINDREKKLNKIKLFYNVDLEQAKNLFIRLLYGGTFKNWADDNHIIKEELDEIKYFAEEMTNISKKITKNNNEILTQVKKVKQLKNQKDFNENSSVLSFYLQEIERRILETIYIYCKDHNIIVSDVVVLSADGIMIESKYYTSDLLTEFTKLITSTYNLNLIFISKSLKPNIIENIDEYVLTEDEIVTNILNGYNVNFTFDKNEEFNIKKLQYYFDNDLKQLDPKDYIKYFHFTNSFRYFNHYHASFYLSNTVYKINGNIIESYSDFKNAFEHLQFVMENEKKNEKKIWKFTNLYIQNKNKQIYSSCEFDPSRQNKNDKYNLFTGFKYDKLQTEYDYDIVKIFTDHVAYVCNETDKEVKIITEYVLQWIAHIIQKPFSKTKVAIVIYSIEEGIGKNIISDIISKLFYGYCVKFKDTQSLVDKFNGEMMGKLFCVGDEINARAAEVANELKDIIVRMTETIEFKGKDKFIINDYKNYWFTTNNENVFKITKSDRRFMFIEGAEYVKTKEYYKTLFDFLDNDIYLSHLFTFFATLNISNFNPMNIVTTEYKQRLILANLPAYIRFVKEDYEILSQSEFDLETKKQNSKQWSSKELFKLSVDFAKKNKIQSTYTEFTFAKQFKKIFGEFFVVSGSERLKRFIFPIDKKDRIEDIIKEKYL